MRLFVGVALTEEARQRAAALLDRLRPLAPAAKWERAENLHLTLAFLGEVEDGRRAGIEAALRKAALGGRAHALSLGGGGAFGPARRPTVLWAGVGGEIEALAALQGALAAALAPLGFPPDPRPFVPHLTLARSREPRGDPALVAAVAALAPESLGALPVHELVLYRSESTKAGKRYLPLATAPLAARG